MLVATRQLEAFAMKYAVEHLTTNGTSNANITSTGEHFGELLIKPTLKLYVKLNTPSTIYEDFHRGSTAARRATTTLSNVEAILQLIPSHAALVYSIHLGYWTFMLCSTDTCQIKVSVDQYHMPYRGLRCSSRAFVKLTVDRVLSFY